MYRYFLAIRYVLSRRVNLLGMIGVSLGVWALIVVVAIFSGYLTEVKKRLIGATSDIGATLIPEDTAYVDLAVEIEADPNVAACSPRIVWYGVSYSPDAEPARGNGQLNTNGIPGASDDFIALLGVDPTIEKNVTAMTEWIENVDDPDLRVADASRPLAELDGEPTLVLSTARAKAHGLSRGDRVHVSSGVMHEGRAGEALELVEGWFRVGGCFDSEFAVFDGFHVYAHIDAMRALLGAKSSNKSETWVNEIAIRVKDARETVKTSQRIRRRLNRDLPPFRNPIRVRTAEQANSQEILSIDHQRSLMQLVLYVIMIVAAFLVFATLSMMVTEKTHDIGILTALGATPRGVTFVFLACGLTISITGAVLGVLTGCVSAIYTDAFNTLMKDWFDVDLFPTAIYNLTHVPCELDPVWIATVAGSAIGLGLVVSGIPAWRAGRHDPLESLRNE